MEKLDQELWYKSSEDYRDHAMRKIAEQQQMVEELGLKQDCASRSCDSVGQA